ncbi:hypothetical protein Q644_26105 [Brucella intermedia 229E]|uniref:Uncharacterized protein n=1 Tax=Brucella intermedia 229E TaxID=1337887 RepID=U4V790_9HYPH|nr:hypothetical protein Q644_26105 [Brucella intermedia 229E]
MSDMKNRVAIVTGASRGIGAAIAERLGRDGFTVIVNYVGNAAMANAVVARIEAAGGVALSAQADVADPVAVKKMFDAAETAFGGVDVLINNAGIMSLSPPLAATEDLDFDKTVSVNLKGTFNTMREAGRRLRDNGRIINFSTSVVGLKLENYGIYAATKAAVQTLTAIMAKEMRGRNITVNAVAPAPPRPTSFWMENPRNWLLAWRR